MVQQVKKMQQNESSATDNNGSRFKVQGSNPFPPAPRPALAAGMVFAVNSGSSLAHAINFFQKAKSVDNESTYNHAGIIVGTKGRTFEALWKIRYSGLDAYKGCPVIIACHKLMTEKRFEDAWPKIAKLNGNMYPFPRLPLHALGLAKYVHWKYPVCSELVAKFEFECELRRNWWGINPDNLADEWRISKHYEIIFEGEWI
jgi:hypothetical protein